MKTNDPRYINAPGHTNDPRYALTAENIYKVTPDVLKGDEGVAAFIQAAAKIFAERVDEVDRIRIFSDFDGLSEELLDILARDFKVDWYNYDYSLETKRETFKRSFDIHRILGTPEAVARALSAAFPGSYIEEWFDYGGKPHHFQIVIETKAAREPANTDDILRAVQLTKRLSSHCDGIVYQCDMSIIIETHEDVFHSRATYPGQHNCGIVPKRSTHAGFTHDDIQVETSTEGFEHSARRAGTLHERSTHAGFVHDDIDIETATQDFAATAERAGRKIAGTIPDRSTHAGFTADDIRVETTAKGIELETKRAGNPDTIHRQNGNGFILPGGLYAEVNGEGFPYRVPWCGRKVCGTKVRHL